MLHEHKWINLDAAEALAQHTSEHELDLNGLTSISVEVAGALARCQTGLCLNGLTSISVEMAEALAKHTTGLCLFGLTSISVEVAATLAAHRGLLNLGGLTSLSDAAADALEVHGNVFVGTNLTIETVKRFETINLAIAERFLASPHQPSFFFKYKWIDLDAAEALAKHTAGLFLSGLTSISVEVAEALAKHTSDEGLELSGLTSISVEVAEALAKHPDGLFLSGLTSISVEVAEALAKCSYLDIPLDSLPPAAAQILRDAGHGE
ncbi:MAG: hypothetical protein HOJ62_12030 [Planctomycetaceae bacterium]|nr:hypothetical protein [Planctomycetaceae bacterium]